MKREKKCFGIFDWCILTLAAVLLAVGAFIFYRRTEVMLPNVEIDCILRLPASAESPEIYVGDEVRNENGTVAFGRVTNISEYPYQTAFLRDETPMYGIVEGLTETELTVRMIAEKSNDYRVGDIRVCAGTTGTYRIGTSYFTGVYTVHLSEVKSNE